MRGLSKKMGNLTNTKVMDIFHRDLQQDMMESGSSDGMDSTVKVVLILLEKVASQLKESV